LGVTEAADPDRTIVGMTEVSRILDQIQQGGAQAADQLLPLVYDELRRLAAANLADEKPGQTLDATALVHEAWLRLVPEKQPAPWKSRRYFFAAAAEAMRRILVENARRKRRLKHGGDMHRREMPADLPAASEPDEDLVALDAALTELALRYPVHARLVELRHFAGMTGDEAARVLEISPSTADRHWVFARAWLRRKLLGHENAENS
jgi:RNA polymerase sigma factor (TIGR02999 family)